MCAAPTDEVLVQRGARGDRVAFEELLERHLEALFNFAVRACGSGRDAEDALQDALLAAWRGAGTFRGEASARSWLFQVVLHACHRRRRKRAGEPQRHASVEEAADVAADLVAADELAVSGEEAAVVERALLMLTPDSREVLLLRDVEGLSGPETAAALGLSLPAMKSRLHRARLELKERSEALVRGAAKETP